MTPKNWTGTIVQVESVRRRGTHDVKAKNIHTGFKAQLVLEELTSVRDRAEICREYRLRSLLFTRWREEFLEPASGVLATQPSRGDEQGRISELRRMVGWLTMELEVAPKSLEHLDFPLEQKRQVMDVLAQQYPASLGCEVLGCARSSYYYHPTESPDETELEAAIKKEAAKWPTYGYRRITAQLRRQEWLVSHKQLQRLMRFMGIQV